MAEPGVAGASASFPSVDWAETPKAAPHLAAGLPAPLHLEACVETSLLLPLLVAMGRAEESRRPGKGRFHDAGVLRSQFSGMIIICS